MSDATLQDVLASTADVTQQFKDLLSQTRVEVDTTFTKAIPVVFHYTTPGAFSLPPLIEEPKKKRTVKKKAKAETEQEPYEPHGPPIPPREMSRIKLDVFRLTPALDTETGKRLFTRMGFEYSFMPKDYDPKDPDSVKEGGTDFFEYGVNNEMRFLGLYSIRLALRRLGLRKLADRVYMDSHVVEIPSTPVATWVGLRREYEMLHGLAQDAGLIARTSVIGSGSLHMNLDLSKRLAARLVRDIANRPYLYWAFNDPCDTQDACVPETEMNQSRLCKALVEAVPGSDAKVSGPLLFHTPYEQIALRAFAKYGSAMTFGPIRWKHVDNPGRFERVKGDKKAGPVMEMRLFDSPMGWAELKVQVEFMDAYLRYLASVKFRDIPCAQYDGQTSVVAAVKGKKLTLLKCEQEFKSLLRKLGLKESKYERQLFNLRRRWELGTNYLL